MGYDVALATRRIPAMANVHFHFRIAPDELALIKSGAQKVRQTPSEFARDAVFARLGKVDEIRKEADLASAGRQAETEEIINRLIGLNDSVADFRLMVKDLGDRLGLLGIAAVASAAMLVDTEKLSDDAATAKVVAHIDEALDVAPGILQHRVESAPSSDA